jgi:hypothetical protein
MCGCIAVYCEKVFYFIHTPLIERISTVFEIFVLRTKQIFIPVLIQQHVSAWQAIIDLTKNSSIFVVNLMMACQAETCCWTNNGLNICVCIDDDLIFQNTSVMKRLIKSRLVCYRSSLLSTKEWVFQLYRGEVWNPGRPLHCINIM